MHLDTIIGFAVVGIIALIVLGLPTLTIRRLVRNRRAGKSIRVNVITLAAYVVVVAALIAVPHFLKFQAKAKCSEAKTNLGAVFTTQVQYFGEHNTYGADFTGLGWPAYGDNSTCGDGTSLDLSCFTENNPYSVPALPGNRR